jgi:hypothetical protein
LIVNAIGLNNLLIFVEKLVDMKTTKFKTTGNRLLFDEEMTTDKLSEIGNPLEKISLVIDF